MKLIRIRGHLNEAHFRVPTWNVHERTYPLPPYSTVIGMVHNMCQWKRYHNMKVSVSGYGIPNTDIVKRWKGGARVKTLSDEFQQRFSTIVQDNDGYYVGYTETISYYDFIANMDVCLHIAPDDQNEIDFIYQSLMTPPVFPSLGKNEHLLRIDEVCVTEISDFKETKLSYDTYAPVDSVDNILGSVFSLHKDYVVKNNRRVFNDVKAFLLGKGMSVETYIDTEGYPVFLA